MSSSPRLDAVTVSQDSRQVLQLMESLEKAWRSEQRPDLDAYLPAGPERRAALIELCQIDLEYRLKAGDVARVEDYLARYPELTDEPTTVLALIHLEQTQRRRREPDLQLDEYRARFPDFQEQLQDTRLSAPKHGVAAGSPATVSEVTQDHRSAPELPPAAADSLEQRPTVGRYQVKRILGKGGFGMVFMGYDDQLQRLVAIKVPHARLIAQAEDAAPYLAEARTVANLDHGNIVPVYDVGGTADCPCFVVSKYIEGSSLAEKIKEARVSLSEATEIVATVAEALHYAHRKGLVHRDVKPGNILLEGSGKPYLADFGLALSEQNIGKGPRFAGTPAYMSPEQARGEGHRVDGRSDLFSLGVVFYELLTGRRPFRSDSREELLEQITTLDARPPRQWDETIPRELERICLKALAKRASDRYATAHDLAADLRHWQQGAGEPGRSPLVAPVPGVAPADQPPSASGQPASSASESRAVRIVPKGLRSFDESDADFFLELLPGPRDRAGLPESLRFWKTRIEEQDADQTFAVGLLYGPSGCGKSSLVKAGLLPRLSGEVLPVYVEAAAEQTETRLAIGLRKRFPGLPSGLGLKDTLAALRQGQGLPAGRKVLLILDQFEQWLHGRKQDNTELVQALRQCDGGRVQALLLVRDDFWMAVTRFLGELEIELIQGRNCAAADLFDLDHARRVLAALGRAFGKLPEQAGETSAEQKEFLRHAVSALSQDGKVVCVRLALFAEMLKGKPWTSATLKEVGGAEGVGVAFLDETFTFPSANPRHRLHQRAARAVLSALLPDSDAEIKGALRSRAELLAASGYADRPRDFEALLEILDNEIRLITPTDPQGKDEGGGREG